MRSSKSTRLYAFAEALALAEAGLAVRRRGWIGENPMWLTFDGTHYIRHFISRGREYSYLWLPVFTADMRERDWYVVDRLGGNAYSTDR